MSTNRSEILTMEILDFFKAFIDDLVMLCESEIEKQTLLLFLKYIFCDKFRIKVVATEVIHTNDFAEWHFKDLDRINDYQEWIFMINEEIERLTRIGYKIYGPDMIKTIGIKFRDEHDWEITTYTEYNLIPQYKLELNNNYRLDFALLGKHFKNNVVVKESKIAMSAMALSFIRERRILKETIKRIGNYS